MNTSTLLTAEEAAERLHCSVWTIYHELGSGRLRGSKPKKVWLVSESAIQEYLAKYSNEPAGDSSRRRRRRKW